MTKPKNACIFCTRFSFADKTLDKFPARDYTHCNGYDRRENTRFPSLQKELQKVAG